MCHHFFFVLALIDVLVIPGTLYANHRNIASFDFALEDVVTSPERQRWQTDVWIAATYRPNGPDSRRPASGTTPRRLGGSYRIDQCLHRVEVTDQRLAP